MAEGISKFDPSSEGGSERSESTLHSIAQAMVARDYIEVERYQSLLQSPALAGVDPEQITRLLELRQCRIFMTELALKNPNLTDRELVASPDFRDSALDYIMGSSVSERDLDEDEKEDLRRALSSGLTLGVRNGMVPVIEEAGVSGKNTSVEKLGVAEQIAAERGLIVEEVFMYEDHFLELRRRLTTPEEALNTASRSIDILRKQFIPMISNVLRGMFGGIALVDSEDNEDLEDLLEEIEGAMPELKTMLNGFIEPAVRSIKTDLERVWGKDLADRLEI